MEKQSFFSLAQFEESLADMTRADVLNNFVDLLKLKYSMHIGSQGLVDKLLQNLSSNDLAGKFPELIYVLRSGFFLTSQQAEKLMDLIEPGLLFGRFEELRQLSINDTDQDVRRVAMSTLLRVVMAWPIAVKVEHLDFAFELENSNDQMIREVGVLLILQIMETWSDEKNQRFCPRFILGTGSTNLATSHLAAKLALRVFKIATIDYRISKIHYLTNFKYFSDEKTAKEFQTLALDTIVQSWGSELINRYWKFLLYCCDSKDSAERIIAEGLLLKVNADDLDIRSLVALQCSEVSPIRRQIKTLTARMSSSKLKGELMYFLDCQQSFQEDLRSCTANLALQISREDLLPTLDYLKGIPKNKPGQYNLAERLITIGTHTKLSEKITQLVHR